ncbi:hypothetical protein [Paenibacillus sedimenti]|uniref:Uncharacterized protein n=1 Tax=Paenibacillus sedimenti TaxID=2770274 RepID=A0A926QK47_9BACL|nr:hypothetical protein [Paenibacillus sedimenti]MBD0381373.1 hypothetical protein [Paenibacillus sedimenti]
MIKELLFRSEQKWLYQMSAIGFLLGGICCVCLLVQQAGFMFPPELQLHKPTSFCLAFGVFLSTTALIMPLSGLASHSRANFQRLLSIAVYYGYTVEIIQVFRGVDPRFGVGNFYTDILPGILDGVLFIAVIVMYVWLIAQFFLERSYQIHPLLVLGIRYGLLAAIIGFGSGVWMILAGGRLIGEQGNIMTVHFLGFHGLQAAPILAILLSRCPLSLRARLNWLHVSGLLWLMLSAYSIVPTILGRSLFQWSDPWVFPVYVIFVLWGILNMSLFTFYLKHRFVVSR